MLFIHENLYEPPPRGASAKVISFYIVPLYLAYRQAGKGGLAGHVPVNKNWMIFLGHKGRNIAEKWIREVSKRPPLQKF
jgi:hypothetical protein